MHIPRTQRYRAGRLEVRPDEHAALVDGRPLSLTLRELQLLTELTSNADRIMSREELYEAVWGRPPRRSDRSLDIYVSRLRAKLGQALPELEPSERAASPPRSFLEARASALQRLVSPRPEEPRLVASQPARPAELQLQALSSRAAPDAAVAARVP